MEGRRRCRCHRLGRWSAVATALLWALLAVHSDRGDEEVGERQVAETFGGGGSGGRGGRPQLPMVSINAYGQTVKLKRSSPTVTLSEKPKRGRKSSPPSLGSTVDGGNTRQAYAPTRQAYALGKRGKLSFGHSLPPEKDITALMEELKARGEKFSSDVSSSAAKKEKTKGQKKIRFVTGSPTLWRIDSTTAGSFLNRDKKPHPDFGDVKHDLKGEYPSSGFSLLPLVKLILASLGRKGVPIYTSSSPPATQTFSAAYSSEGNILRRNRQRKGSGEGTDVAAMADKKKVYGVAFLITPEIRKDAEDVVKEIIGYVDTKGNAAKNAELRDILGESYVNLYSTNQPEGKNDENPLGSSIPVVPQERLPPINPLSLAKVYTVDSKDAFSKLLGLFASFQETIAMGLKKKVNDVMGRYVGHQRAFPPFKVGINGDGSGFVVPLDDLETEKLLLEKMHNTPIDSSDTEFLFVPMRLDWESRSTIEQLGGMQSTFHRRSKGDISTKKQG